MVCGPHRVLQILTGQCPHTSLSPFSPISNLVDKLLTKKYMKIHLLVPLLIFSAFFAPLNKAFAWTLIEPTPEENETEIPTTPTFRPAPTFNQSYAAPVYYRTPVSNYVPAPAAAYITPPAPVYYPSQSIEPKTEPKNQYRKNTYTRETNTATYQNTKRNEPHVKEKNIPTYQAPSYAKTSVYTYTRTFANDSYQRTLEPESYRSSDEIYTYQPEATAAYTRVYVPDTYYYTYQ